MWDLFSHEKGDSLEIRLLERYSRVSHQPLFSGTYCRKTSARVWHRRCGKCKEKKKERKKIHKGFPILPPPSPIAPAKSSHSGYSSTVPASPIAPCVLGTLRPFSLSPPIETSTRALFRAGLQGRFCVGA